MGKWALCCVLALVGCSSSSGGGPGGASGAGADGGGSAGTSNAGAGGVTAGSAGMASAGTSSAGSANGGTSNTDFTSTLVSLPAIKRGLLHAAQYTADKTTFSTIVSAEFGNGERGAWDGCTRHQLGSCWYYDCPPGSNGLGVIDDSVKEVAGAVYATGSSSRVDLSPNADGTYAARGMTELWPPAGGSISFTVVGSSNVPAFSTQIAAPPFVLLTSMNGQAVPSGIRRSDGAKLVWASAGTGSVFFAIFMDTGGPRPGAFCQFDAAANAGSMPAAVLEKLDPGTQYRYQFRGDLRSQMTVGDWEIESSAYSFGSNLNGNAPVIVLQ